MLALAVITHDDATLRVLARLGSEIARVMHRDELCRAIVRIVKEELGHERVTLWLFDERRGALALEASESSDGPPRVSLMPIDRGINGWVFRHAMPRLAPDVRRDSEFREGGSDCASELAVPLVAHGDTLGTLDLQSPSPSAFGEADLTVLATVAPSMAAAIEVSTLHERLREAALTDSLTGLANFRGFSHSLHQEIARGRRYRQVFAVVRLDVDGLRTINERDGQLAGDAALRSLSADLRVVLRATDVLARQSGDDFTLLLAQTTRQQAETTMRRFADWTDLPVSFGIAEFPSDGEEAQALLAAAERELERAKRSKAS